MQLFTFLAFAAITLSTTFGVSALEPKPDAHETTLWVPTATVVETNTYVATRIDQIWTTVSPYEWETTYPITWTATQTATEYAALLASSNRQHARDFEVQ